MKNKVSQKLKEHYARKFREYGATPKGVDWNQEADVLLRYEKMLGVISNAPGSHPAIPSILDVGCGYGGLLIFSGEKKIPLHYTGIDVVEEMIEYSRNILPAGQFYCKDILEMEQESYDFVVCNGILTQKLTTSIRDMDLFAKELINKMFSVCNKGIAFNVMTDKVNFMVDNLYYKNPVEMFAYCLSEISDKVLVDHAYPLYEYTVYVYKT